MILEPRNSFASDHASLQLLAPIIEYSSGSGIRDFGQLSEEEKHTRCDERFETKVSPKFPTFHNGGARIAADYIIRPSMDIAGKPRMSGADQPWLKLSA